MSHAAALGDWFYKHFTAGDAPPANFPAAPQVDLPFAANHLRLRAVTQPVEFSFNGKDTHGIIEPGFGLVNFDEVTKSKIWLKSAGGTIHVYAWPSV